MTSRPNRHRVRPRSSAGWEAALLEFEHQAEHWDTPDHGETGHLIAQALLAAVEIAESGGLRCGHRGGSLPQAVSDPSSTPDAVTLTLTADDRHNRDAA